MFCRILIKMSEPDMFFLFSQEMANKQFLKVAGLIFKHDTRFNA